MKSELVTASTVLFLLLSAMPICTVGAQNVELLSEGDTFTYERYHIWTSNDPNGASPDVDFFTALRFVKFKVYCRIIVQITCWGYVGKIL